MSLEILFEAAGETRRLGPGEALSLGGAGSDVVLPEATGVLAHLGSEEGALFVQPADGARPVVCNGSRLASSHWLHDGDVVTVGGAALVVRRDGDTLRVRLRERAGRRALPPEATPGAAEPAEEWIEPWPFEPVRLAAGRRRPRLPGVVTIAVGSLLLLLAGLAWYVLTARGIRIEIEPPPDRARIEALWTPRLGDSYLLRPGRYRLVAEKEGYRRLEETLEVTRDSPATLRFILEALPARLELRVEPAVEAAVTVDGRPVGTTPLEPLELALGSHRVEVVAPGFRAYAAEVEMVEAGGIQSLVARLERNSAPVTLTSEPAGAMVRLDGAGVGKTPVTVEVEEGDHRAVWLLAGYKPAAGSFAVVAGEPLTIAAPRFEPAAGNLLLQSEPPGATVAVNGAYRGVTPLELELEAAAAHRLRVSKAGYETRDEELRLPPGESRLLEIVLVRKMADVRVVSRPPGAEVSIDGTPRGTTGERGLTLSLPEGEEVRLTLSKSGYESQAATVTPRAGREQSVEVELVTPAERQAAATPPRLEPTHGPDMILVRGGRFTMGAPRREPGRRANEAEHQVELVRPFYVAAREVSNREFREFDSRHLSGKQGAINLEFDDHPAVRVSWEQAALYCNWLSEKESLPPVYTRRGGRLVARQPIGPGYRLPTEAEWAWVARFPRPGAPRKYIWGDALPVAPGSANFGALPGYRDDSVGTAPVESFGADARGFYHLGGNVAEWVHDVYRERPGGGGVARDPVGGDDGSLHVIRGAGWLTATVTELRLTYRESGNEGRPDVGFRVARYAE